MLKYFKNRYWWKGGDSQAQHVKALGFVWDEEYGLWCTKFPFIAENLKGQIKDDDTKNKLNKDMNRTVISSDCSRGVSGSFMPPSPENLKYLPFQSPGIGFITKRKNTLLADDMGLGKTIQAIGAINVWEGLNKILIICPASVKLQWRDEIRKWCTKFFNILIVDGRSDERVYQNSNEIIIMNYALVPYYEEFLSEFKQDLKIVDECHYLMTKTAKRTEAVLSCKSDRNIFLSGTPGEKPYELWPVLNHLDPFHFDNEWNFVRRYCAPKVVQSEYKDKERWDFGGADNLEELQYALRSTLMLRRTKSQVMPQLGEKIKTILPIELGSCLNFEKRLIEKYGYDSVLEKLSAGEFDSDENMAASRRQIGIAKIPYVIESINLKLRETGKIVCFAWHQDVMSAFLKHYGNACVVVNGLTTSKKKEANKKRFLEDPSCKIYFGQISTMTGVDGLQKVADTAIFAEVDWSYKNMVQAEDRLPRHGQEAGSVNYYYLVADNSLEAYMVKKLQIKKNNHNAMFDSEVKNV